MCCVYSLRCNCPVTRKQSRREPNICLFQKEGMMYPHEQPDRPCEITAQSEALPSSKNTHHAKHPLNVKELLGYMQYTLGGGSIIALTIATIVLCFLSRPAGQ